VRKHEMSAIVGAVGSVAMVVACWPSGAVGQQPSVIHQPYVLNTGLVSRSISFENSTGALGEGGKSASNLGEFKVYMDGDKEFPTICGTGSEDYVGLAETQDDWSCATFWYEPVPSAALPTLPDVKARTADLWKN
jgi:hypothetical protein